MIDSQKKNEKSMLLTDLVTLILGIILMIEPKGSIRIMTATIGILFIIAGIFSVISYIKKPKELKIRNVSLVVGILMITGGLYISLSTESLVKFVTLILGISLFVKSLFKVQFALNTKSVSSKWKSNLIMGLITMFLGIILFLNPFDSAAAFLRICGIALAVMSAVDMVTTFMVIRSLKDYKELSFVDKK